MHPPDRLRLKPAPWLTRDLWEDLQLCLRWSLAAAHAACSMETQPQAWFSALLGALRRLHFDLVEHTHKRLPYPAHRAALADVYQGYLPPPRELGPWYASLGDGLGQASGPGGPVLRALNNTSSHLSIELEREEDGSLVAVLFYVYCSNAPLAPTRQLNLVFDHLGARFDAQAFAALRPGLEAEVRADLQHSLRAALD